LFESFRWPWLVLVTIPASFVGLFLCFGWFDFYFDQGGYAAFVLLGGLVVNAAIFVLYDYQRRLGTSRQAPTRLLVKALIGKALPISLTVLSTVLGLTPFLLEGQAEVFWFALAAGTCGGLIYSLPVIFVLLPTLVAGRRSAGPART
ncbi:MAG: efflux RND transporter permease subunit, partial [Catalinimonas sp.]